MAILYGRDDADDSFLTGASGVTNGDDIIYGFGGNDQLFGAGGNDVLIGGVGADGLQGGDGIDTVDYSASYREPGSEGLTMTVDLSAGTGRFWDAQGDQYAGIENVIGSRFGDVIVGSAVANILIGGEGDDRLQGMAGADTLIGGSGIDTVSYADAAAAVTVSLANGGSVGDAQGDTFEQVENVLGSAGADTIGGDEGANALSGSGGGDYLKGAGGDDTLDGGAGADEMEGGLGNDTYYVADAGDIVDEAAFGGGGRDVVLTTLSIDLGDSARFQGDVEDAVLASGSAALNASGNGLANEITGNEAANLLQGRAGDDTLIGGAGADTMQGGANDDTYEIDGLTDRVYESVAGSNGIDTIRAAFSFSLSNATVIQGSVENLNLLGTGNFDGIGNALSNAITGNAGRNLLLGQNGNDTLAGAAGADTMRGGAGDDTYDVEGGDTVDEQTGGSGIDTIRSALTFDLAAPSVTVMGTIENLTLTGLAAVSGRGDGNANVVTGNEAANRLDGRNGNDRLVGAGGADLMFGGEGNDTLDGGAGIDDLRGGAGNDVYKIDEAGDTIVEAVGEGTDIVTASVDFVLSAGVSVEVIQTAAPSGTAFIDLTGNNQNQSITGNAGANILMGLGGNDTLNGAGGSDEMHGGTGDDFFYVDSNADKVRENAGEGFDRVITTGNFSLFATAEIEVLQASANAVGPLQLIGNDFRQSIVGSGEANYINGNGGADTMTGLGGDDTYVVDNAADIITEGNGGGTDTVLTSVSYALRGGQFVEALKTTNAAGTGAIDLTGNEYAQAIEGNEGANVIQAGRGADRLTGHGGTDKMYVGTADGAIDVVVWTAVSDSTGPARDLLIGFDMDQDRFEFSVKPLSTATLTTGALNTLTFNADLTTAMTNAYGAGGMADAVLFDPSGGNLNADSQRYLIVDANNDGNYTADFDYVVQLQGATGTLSAGDFI